jgi:tRNA nucleotidyltransferase (CCA-adding enzyme)
MVERGDTDELSKERVTDEIGKLLIKARKPSVGMELMREIGLIEHDYPELKTLIGTPQEPDWHPEGDVWSHTLMVLDAGAEMIRDTDRDLTEEEKRQIMLGCLCHDLGKPATTETIDGRIRSRGHEEAGEAPAKSLLARWSFSKRDEQAALAAVTRHLSPGSHLRSMQKGEITETQLINITRRMIRRIHPVSWKVLICVAEADTRGRNTDDAEPHAREIRETYERIIREHLKEETTPLLQGNDLVNLGFVPGPVFGTIIEAVEAERDAGRISTKEDALDFVRKRYLNRE